MSVIPVDHLEGSGRVTKRWTRILAVWWIQTKGVAVRHRNGLMPRIGRIHLSTFFYFKITIVSPIIIWQAQRVQAAEGWRGWSGLSIQKVQKKGRVLIKSHSSNNNNSKNKDTIKDGNNKTISYGNGWRFRNDPLHPLIVRRFWLRWIRSKYIGKRRIAFDYMRDSESVCGWQIQRREVEKSE